MKPLIAHNLSQAKVLTLYDGIKQLTLFSCCGVGIRPTAGYIDPLHRNAKPP